MLPAARNSVLRFGVFEFEPRNGILRRHGKQVRLPPQPARILEILVTRPGEVVTREELRQQVWGQDTFVDFEHGLNYSVRRIRMALHDDAKKPRYVETLSRRGYRFIGLIEQASRQTCKAMRSLAVLPLENLSHNPEQEYFADGITDGLITEIAKLSALRVISRTSVQRYKRCTKPVAEIARRLKVDVLLEGTVLRSGNRVRISAQLINAERDEHLWAETYERDLGDVLKLQAELTQVIAKQIHIRLSAQEEAQLNSASAIHPEAYECYLRGRHFWNKRTEADLKRAQEYFDQVIEKAPHYALAYSGLADTYLYRGYVFGRLDPMVAMPKARAAVMKALELDPRLGEAHTSMGFLNLMFDWDLASAEREYQMALELNRNYPTAHHFYSALLAIMGRTDEAIEEIHRALVLDPLSVPIHNMMGEIYMFAGRLDAAISQYRKALELEPDMAMVHENLGTALELQGRDKEALEEYLKAYEFWGESPELVLDVRHSFESGGWVGFRERRLELAMSRRTGWHFETFHIAILYAGLGNDEKALEWLEKACDARSAGLVWITLFPYFKKLFPHPRFRAVAKRVGLPVPAS